MKVPKRKTREPELWYPHMDSKECCRSHEFPCPRQPPQRPQRQFPILETKLRSPPDPWSTARLLPCCLELIWNARLDLGLRWMYVPSVEIHCPIRWVRHSQFLRGRFVRVYGVLLEVLVEGRAGLAGILLLRRKSLKRLPAVLSVRSLTWLPLASPVFFFLRRRRRRKERLVLAEDTLFVDVTLCASTAFLFFLRRRRLKRLFLEATVEVSFSRPGRFSPEVSLTCILERSDRTVEVDVGVELGETVFGCVL